MHVVDAHPHVSRELRFEAGDVLGRVFVVYVGHEVGHANQNLLALHAAPEEQHVAVIRSRFPLVRVEHRVLHIILKLFSLVVVPHGVELLIAHDRSLDLKFHAIIRRA